MKIAIDGTAASGKGTLGKRLSKTLQLPYLDTGLLFRQTAYLYLKSKKSHCIDIFIDPETLNKVMNEINIKNLNFTTLQEDLYGKFASKIARIMDVRKKLKKIQLNFAKEMLKEKGGCILDGRDIGTNILPNADYKFFVDAPLNIRAERRYKQLQLNNNSLKLKEIELDLKIRDYQDKTREHAPLTKTKDSIYLNTGELDPSEVEKKALSFIKIKDF